jgi:hypothetical protein
MVDQLGLPPEAIKQFQEINRKRGIIISDEEATKRAYCFLNLFLTLNGHEPTLLLFNKKD